MFYSNWKCAIPNLILSTHFVEGITEENEAKTLLGEVSVSAMKVPFFELQKPTV